MSDALELSKQAAELREACSSLYETVAVLGVELDNIYTRLSGISGAILAVMHKADDIKAECDAVAARRPKE